MGMNTPEVGDIVRVVLEGEVQEMDSTYIKVGWNDVCLKSAHIESIEILEPARPSVADLPVGSVLRDDDGIVFIKLGANMPRPWGDQWGARYTDADLGMFRWTPLVEKSDG